MKEKLLSESKNIGLKRIGVSDLEDLYELWNKEYIFEFQPFNTVQSMGEAKQIIINIIGKLRNTPNQVYIIRDLGTRELLGQISYTIEGFQAEIGISIAEAALGKGISDEALRLVEQEITDKCLADSCVVNMSPSNKHCYRLFNRNGYVLAMNDDENKRLIKSLNVVSTNIEVISVLKSLSNIEMDYMLDKYIERTNMGKSKAIIKVFMDKIVFECIFTFYEDNGVNLNIFKNSINGEKMDRLSVKGDIVQIMTGLKLFLESEKKKYGTL